MGTDELERLLAAVGRGDARAFEALYRATSAHLFALALRIVGERGSAEEIIQETFVGIWRHAASYDGRKGGAMTWLRTMARNQAIDARRRRRPTVSIEDDPSMEALADERADVFGATARSEQGRRLAECLGRLGARARRAIVEAYYGGLTHEEIAARLDAPLGTVKSSIRRGLRQLAECLGHAAA